MFNFNIVSFTDETGTRGAFRSAVESALGKVMKLIDSSFRSPGGTYDVVVSIKDIGAFSMYALFKGSYNSENPKQPIVVFANEISKGVDVNGPVEDAVLNINPAFIDSLAGDYLSTANANRIATLMLHEVMHTMGIGGFINAATGARDSQYESPFDSHVLIDYATGNAQFSGVNVNSLEGGPIALQPFGASGIYHVKNDIVDVVNPIVAATIPFSFSDLDLAIFKDLGLSPKKTLISKDGHTYLAGTDATGINGAPGAPNTVKFDGMRNDYGAFLTQNSALVSQKADASSAYTVTNIKHLQFNDVSVNLGIQSNAAAISPGQLKTIVDLYVAFFNRIPDADGLDYWISAFRGGETINKIADSFYAAGVANSQYTGYLNTSTNSDFVKTVYKNALQRSTFDQEGLNYWTNGLNTGSETRGTLVTQILAAAHTSKDTTYGDFSYVAKLLDNKYTVATISAIQQGLTDLSPATAITHGMAIANAVTSTDMSAAIKLIGVMDAHLVV